MKLNGEAEDLDTQEKNSRSHSLFAGTILYLLFLLVPLTVSAQEKNEDEYQYVLIEAVRLKNMGQLNEAAHLYKMIIGEKPDCHVARFELGTIYLMMNQPSLAATHLQEAYEMGPDNQWYTMAYVNALGASEEYDLLVTLLKEKRKTDPENPEWSYQLAVAWYSKNKPSRAVSILNNMENEFGFSEKVTLMKASIYEEEGDYKQAMKELNKVMVLFPELIQFKVVAAELCMKLGKEEDAASYYMSILETDSTNIFAITNLSDHFRKKGDHSRSLEYLEISFRHPGIEQNKKRGILSYYMSDTAVIASSPEGVARLIEAYLETYPDDQQLELMAVDHYIQLQDYAPAYIHLKSFLESSEADYQLYYHAVLLASSIPDHPETLLMSERAIELYPDSSDLYFFKVYALSNMERHREVTELLLPFNMATLSNDDFRFQATGMLAESCYRIGAFEVSDSIFEQLIQEQPEPYLYMNNYSYYLAERGEKLERALELIDVVLEALPDEATYLDTKAWILYKMEDYKKAGQYIRKAMENGGENDPEVNEHAGDIEGAMGNKELARTYYLKAMISGGNKEHLEKKIHASEAIMD